MMRDDDCVGFLQWALPRMGLRWEGFRKVRGQVCKRIGRRCTSLGLLDVSAYRSYLECHSDEWETLQALCGITVSRFCRDHIVFDHLHRRVLPALAAGSALRPDQTLACWSAGCASGEEAYSLSILWRLEFAPVYPRIRLSVLGSDADPVVLARAAVGCYQESSIKEVPPNWREHAFEECDSRYCVREAFRAGVRFERRDLRRGLPEALFDLVLCRNLVLTYFAPAVQQAVLMQILKHLRPGGALVVGMHESLPEGVTGITPWPDTRAIFRKSADA